MLGKYKKETAFTFGTFADAPYAQSVQLFIYPK